MNNNIDHYAKIVWDYMLMHQKPEKSDAIFALGSNDTRVAERAAELYLQGYGKYVIFSGGNGKSSHFSRPEAEVFYAIAIQKGVPEGSIILEDKATNTGENILFVKKLLAQMKLNFQSFILVHKPYMERRTFATFSRLWPEIKFIVTSPKISYEDYSQNHNWVNVMVGDLQRIKEYPVKGFQIKQEIPEKVWQAGQELIRLGYDKYSIK